MSQTAESLTAEQPAGLPADQTSTPPATLRTREEAETAIALQMQEGTPMQQLFGAVFQELGGIDFMTEWAEENPDKFMSAFVTLNPPPATAPGGGGNTLNLVIHPSLQAGPLDGTPVKDVN